MLNYNNFILETNMSEEKYTYNLELNKKGKLLEPFDWYYRKENHDNYYFVLKSIPFEEYEPDGNKVTYLSKTIYKDTDSFRNRKLNNVNFDPDNYLFYELYSTKRKNRETHGVSVNFDENRFEKQLTNDNRKHFIVISKNDIVYTVRINSGQRSGHGDKSEKIIADKFGFEQSNTKIYKNIKRNNDILPYERKRSILFDILGMNDDLMNRYDNLFELDTISENIEKYDLIISDGNLKGEKVEVKKYDVHSLFYRDGKSKTLEMAEQLKIASKKQLKDLVVLYSEMNNVNVNNLLSNYDNDKGYELNSFFRTRYNGEHLNLVQEIRNFYNSRIKYMFDKYKNISKDRIMKTIYGVYFFNNETGVDGFLIRTFNEYGKMNFEYEWELIRSQWGLDRIKLVYKVNPNALRMVWLGDDKNFIETFEVGDIKQSELLEKESKKRQYNKDWEVIIRPENHNPIRWNSSKGYWENVPNSQFGLSIKKRKTPN